MGHHCCDRMVAKDVHEQLFVLHKSKLNIIKNMIASLVKIKFTVCVNQNLTLWSNWTMYTSKVKPVLRGHLWDK